MYGIGVNTKIKAYHLLPVEGDSKEGSVHPHDYIIEVKFEGENLDESGYLVDIDKVKYILMNIKEKFNGKILNEMEEFEDVNPTLENFSTVIGNIISSNINENNINWLEIRIWEDEIAYAFSRRKL